MDLDQLNPPPIKKKQLVQLNPPQKKKKSQLLKSPRRPVVEDVLRVERILPHR